MERYKCATCGARVERDLVAFIKHTDKHVIEAIQKDHPEWVAKDGVCHKCLDYYKKEIKGK